MIARLQVMINLFIKKQRKTSLAPRKNPRIRIFIINALSGRLLLLSEIKVEGDIQHEFPGDVFGKGQLLVGSQPRYILHTLMIVVGERIHHHGLHRPFAFVITQGHCMIVFPLVDGLAPKFVIGGVHIGHQRPVPVHADYASTEAPVAMGVRIGIPLADVTVEERIQADGEVLLDRL